MINDANQYANRAEKHFRSTVNRRNSSRMEKTRGIIKYLLRKDKKSLRSHLEKWSELRVSATANEILAFTESSSWCFRFMKKYGLYSTKITLVQKIPSEDG